MLPSLRVRDFLPIGRLDVELCPGLCSLTGTMGAGKSVLIDALSLALGSYAGSGIIRPGAKRLTTGAKVEAESPL